MCEKVLIYSYRYMWRVSDNSEGICFKVVTDTLQGLEEFEKALLSLDNLTDCAKEYLHEYDCSKIGIVFSLKKTDKEEK